MNDSDLIEKKIRLPPPWQITIGSILVIAGLLILADPYLWPGHLRWLALIISGLLLSGWSLWARRIIFWVVGSFLFSLGIVWEGYLFLAPLPFEFIIWMGVIAGGVTISGLIIGLLTPCFFTRSIGWAFILAPLGAVTAYITLFTPAKLSDFAFLFSVAGGLFFIILGVRYHSVGWLIPGGLLLGIGPGIYALISHLPTEPTLTVIGLSLLWFAFGWILISLTSRTIRQSALWWPLIPGGILGIAGISLYIAGNPSATPTLLSNTGSIAIIVFGLYLLLMRRGVQR